MPIKRIITTISAIILSACSTFSSQPPINIEGRWIITEIAEQGSLAQHTPWLDFRAGKVTGHSGCNRFFGDYQVKDNRIAFGPIGSTRKMCPGPEIKQESALLKLLTTPLDIQTVEDTMMFSLKKKTVLRLMPLPENEI